MFPCYLKGKESETDWWTDGMKSSICLFQMLETAVLGQASSRPIWVSHIGGRDTHIWATTGCCSGFTLAANWIVFAVAKQHSNLRYCPKWFYCFTKHLLLYISTYTNISEHIFSKRRKICNNFSQKVFKTENKNLTFLTFTTNLAVGLQMWFHGQWQHSLKTC